ncbi:hypothetical protein BO70DRAFT_228862 [Aspergillus heteromorphus CBS 117.55]|uniref:Secreted protein n=1 Tax=Aspergillus heteromorphus CBS 117.55 TaxID=1448321 RepID=A0A317WIE2_9EURO|nr:uncharacterized protein BO70DRAFT_228862 [Aspergillus heteromorphus CBS 117.55]PWY84828.1 hypothetical protein BO70DRAFT_228862 [Aspergillus heteromorphus CBS 117.55]
MDSFPCLLPSLLSSLSWSLVLCPLVHRAILSLHKVRLYFFISIHGGKDAPHLASGHPVRSTTVKRESPYPCLSYNALYTPYTSHHLCDAGQATRIPTTGRAQETRHGTCVSALDKCGEVVLPVCPGYTWIFHVRYGHSLYR